MSKGKSNQFFDGTQTRRKREEKQHRRELIDANRGMFDDNTLPEDEIVRENNDYMKLWVPDDKRKWYVVDTNLILDCVDIIYDPKDENWRPPLNFRPNLDNAHIIIPMVVFEELNRMKDERTVNRPIAQKAFKRLSRFFPNCERNLMEVMNLERPVSTGWKQQKISLLPLHRDFADSLPWVPDANDHDGWIAVTALAAAMIRDRMPVDGSVSVKEVLERDSWRKDVILLTRDYALLSKAAIYGVRTKSFHFDQRPEFTGIRELTVPAEMFAQFYYEEQLSLEDFQRFMPKEAPLVANEYIVMTPENDEYPKGYFAVSEPFLNVARYSKKHEAFFPMRFFKKEGAFAPNPGIATYYDAMNDGSISVIVVTGKAGTGKTYQIVHHAIRALKKGDYAKVVLIIDSENGVGYLPGDLKHKVAPMVEFCKDAIRSYLALIPEFKRKRQLLRKFGDYDEPTAEEDVLIDPFDDGCTKSGKRKDKAAKKARKNSPKTYYELLEEETDYIFDRYFDVIPYKQAQGRSFEDAIIIIDEAQRIIIDSMETFITRPAKNSLLVVCGDVNQIKYNSPEKRIKNGLIFTRKIYFDWDGCANIHLTDNMRHEAAEIANRNYEKVIEEIGWLQV
ncbi:PhoH family protein [Candidatus Saccharibacteria bacterium]|nr:PhoH family protein [Candidatus Saccharibacteria bacterium]